MNKQFVLFIIGIALVIYIIDIAHYSITRNQKIANNERCEQSTTLCVFQYVPPSIWEMITHKKGMLYQYKIPGCDKLATTTDCSKLTPLRTPYTFIAEEKSFVTTTQSGKIDEYLTINNTLRYVNFCDKTYKVKQVFIDEMDVVQRIAEIITEMNGESNEKKQFAVAICENIKFRITTGNLDELEISGPSIRNNDYSKYYIGIGRFLIFTINYPSLQLEVSKAEEGSSTVIGVLK